MLYSLQTDMTEVHRPIKQLVWPSPLGKGLYFPSFSMAPSSEEKR